MMAIRFLAGRLSAIGSVVGALICIAGCVSAPDTQMIPERLASAEQIPGNPPRAANTNPWWDYLNDPTLDALIRSGLADNPSPAIAAARLRQAEQELTVARSANWPSLFGNQSRQEQRFKSPETDTRTELSSADLSWDAGLWGRRLLTVQQARQLQQGLWFEQQSVELALSVAIADTYFRVTEFAAQSQLLAAQIAVSEDLENLIEARFRLGQARANELYQQRAQTTLLRQLKLVSDTQHGVLETNLDVLLGVPPDGAQRVSRIGFPAGPADIVDSTPDDLIRHRADIRTGFARLQQAAAEVGIRIADRLPALQVSASLTSLTNRSISTGAFSYALDLTAPLFTGGRLRGLEVRARAALEEERQRYLQLWLAALEEVSTLNWQYQQQQRIIQVLSDRRRHASQALDAARNRYTLGDQNYLDVLTALRGLQEADRLLVTEQRQLITLSIQAKRSMGQPMCTESTDCRERWQI